MKWYGLETVHELERFSSVFLTNIMFLTTKNGKNTYNYHCMKVYTGHSEVFFLNLPRRIYVPHQRILIYNEI